MLESIYVNSSNFRQSGQCNDKGITECDTLAYGNGEGRFCIGISPILMIKYVPPPPLPLYHPSPMGLDIHHHLFYRKMEFYSMVLYKLHFYQAKILPSPMVWKEFGPYM